MNEEQVKQKEKILEMCSDREWHCQNEFRALYIFSPHKRRNEIAGKERESDPATTKYDWLKRPCQHGVRNQFDYKLIDNRRFNPQKKLIHLSTFEGKD